MTASYQPVRAPRGSHLTCKGWPQEAAMRMLMNNLDPEVAEHPEQLIVYGGSGRAARSWDAYAAIITALQDLKATRPSWSSPASPSGSCGRTNGPRECSSPTPTWSRSGPPGRSSAAWSTSA